jgi:CHC2 zinc finger
MLPDVQQKATSGFDPRFDQFQRCLEHVKGEVRIETYAAELTELRFNGKSLRGKCPIHEGENQSAFAVSPGKQKWYCFRCDEGGDVIALCKAVEKHPQMYTAMISLAQRYEVDLPERPASWYRRQREKAEVRDGGLEALTRSYQRRYFKLWGGGLEDIEDEAERKAEGKSFFDDLYKVARVSAIQRMERRRG